MATSGGSLNNLLGLTNVIGAVTGTSQTRRGTQTTRGNITEEGAQRVIDQIMAGRGGVRDISGAARGAGLYNDSTELQLRNDLDARVAGEVAARQAGETTTSEMTIDQPGIGIGNLAIPLIGATLARPLMEGALGLGERALGGVINSLTGGAQLGAQAGTTLASLGTAGSALGTLSGLAPTATNTVAGLTSVGDALGTIPAGATALGETALSSTLPGVGNFISGLLGGQNGDAFGSPFGFGSSVLSGAAAAGPVGMIAAPVLATLGAAFNDLSIICTALRARGLLDEEQYAKGQAYLQTLSTETKAGYYYWATGVAQKINEGSKFWTGLCLPWARSRMNLLASKSKFKYVLYPLGTITLVIGQPLCYLLGSYLMSRRLRHGT